jgi:exonuclease 1
VSCPQQADAQLAYLARCGMIDAVVTEDSDVLAFGCPRVLFKLEPSGHAQEVRVLGPRNCHGRGLGAVLKRACHARRGYLSQMEAFLIELARVDWQVRQEDLFSGRGELDMRGWDLERFLAMCVLSGCDYLPSIPGLGLKSVRGRDEKRDTRASCWYSTWFCEWDVSVHNGSSMSVHCLACRAATTCPPYPDSA